MEFVRPPGLLLIEKSGMLDNGLRLLMDYMNLNIFEIQFVNGKTI